MRLFLFTAVFAMLILVTGANAQSSDDSAPLGLRWGMSTSAVKQLGAELSPYDLKQFGTSYSAKNLPLMLAGVDQVVLSFGYDDKLWRIAVISQDYRNDPYGHGARARYDELCRLLAEKYGKGESEHFQDKKMWKAPEEFVMGISQGQSWWYTDFKTKSLRVQIGLGASGSTTSFWKIFYFSLEQESAFQAAKKRHEKDAL